MPNYRWWRFKKIRVALIEKNDWINNRICNVNLIFCRSNKYLERPREAQAISCPKIADLGAQNWADLCPRIADLRRFGQQVCPQIVDLREQLSRNFLKCHKMLLEARTSSLTNRGKQASSANGFKGWVLHHQIINSREASFLGNVTCWPLSKITDLRPKR
jgi:hypothetical protein